jgi:hypothetical protein
MDKVAFMSHIRGIHAHLHEFAGELKGGKKPTAADHEVIAELHTLTAPLADVTAHGPAKKDEPVHAAAPIKPVSGILPPDPTPKPVAPAPASQGE